MIVIPGILIKAIFLNIVGFFILFFVEGNIIRSIETDKEVAILLIFNIIILAVLNLLYFGVIVIK